MSFWKQIGQVLGGGVGEMGGKLMEGVDKFVTSPDERAALREQMTRTLLEFNTSYQQEISNRHTSDMRSDSWLSKNVRPVTLVFLLAVVSMLSVTDGNIGDFKIQEAYISLYQQLLMLAFAFYFGGRSVEKLAAIGQGVIRDRKRKRNE
tara:strand:- start:9224 stop:9670 length:447 start_codon:yes stop_codon:yes gene_type:complete